MTCLKDRSKVASGTRFGDMICCDKYFCLTTTTITTTTTSSDGVTRHQTVAAKLVVRPS